MFNFLGNKNKYNTLKYRLIVGITNKDIICQIAYARIEDNYIVSSAYAHELLRYDVKLGLTNYTAAYCTGTTDVTGDEFENEPVDGEKHPFRCYLGVGLARTTTDAKVLSALKDAVDGGLDIPHRKKFDADAHRQYIFGLHIANYITALKEENSDLYAKQFSCFVKAGIEPSSFEALYKAVHAVIRADPSPSSPKKADTVKSKW
ncbi:unnamed protein product [Rotaria sordida]|uniref:Large ribosomal subunit protein uL18 C-terminal eukaryotes domain-containing protein n=1 Tax=Rotaria sordida TaxID=392033 RepID=A0A814PQD3_9BILA|nr:unnamed protein product [Rotaria sordida]